MILAGSYLQIPLAGTPIYFTDADPSAGALAGDPDGRFSRVEWTDRGERISQLRQLKRSLPRPDGTVRSAMLSVSLGRMGEITLQYEWMPAGLYPLYRASNNSNGLGLFHAVHPLGTEDLSVEWSQGMQFPDRQLSEGNPLERFRLLFWSHGNAS